MLGYLYSIFAGALFIVLAVVIYIRVWRLVLWAVKQVSDAWHTH